MARRKEAHGGGHGWFVTFADLMGLLGELLRHAGRLFQPGPAEAADRRRLDARRIRRAEPTCAIRASSRSTAFPPGRNSKMRRISIPRTPRRRRRPTSRTTSANTARSSRAIRLSHWPPRRCARRCRTCPNSPKPPSTSWSRRPRRASTSRSSIRKAARCSPEGSKEPYERTRRIIEKLAGPLKATPYRVSITGHTSASKRRRRGPDYGPWNLSVDRANAVRQILEEEGLPSTNIYAVAGKADTDPLFPDDPYIAANRRVTITLMREAPPVPPDLQP